GSEGWDWREQVAQVPWLDTPRLYARNVVVPTVTLHRPAAGAANGTATVVAPGGAFHFLMIEHEGHDMARWLTGLGVTVFVLKYRLMRTPDDDAQMLEFRANLHTRLSKPGRTDTAPPVSREFMREAREFGEEDGRQALRFVRAHAGELGIAPDRIGIAGYSAGGGVAMGAALRYDAASRPDYVAAIYPAWRTELLPVPHDAPPLFLAVSDDDPQVAPMSTSRLYEAWHTSGASAELHVFATGGHGWGMDRHDDLPDIWTTLLERWLRNRRLL
ncbi:MAG TPA: alpha/beta hydrolase fold domain-containing protein, partial [Hypericibacter adhaerens]|uniref:alpha/beta hydrolase n=1 Tax=Hypericibacter adhaerens TaxID=2602016 RepID=UPI002CFF58A9